MACMRVINAQHTKYLEENLKVSDRLRNLDVGWGLYESVAWGFDLGAAASEVGLKAIVNLLVP